MDSASLGEALVTLAIVALAAFVHGALGLGFPLVATPLLALFTDVRSAILLTLVPAVVLSLVSILSDREWRTALRRFWLLPAAAVLGSTGGTLVLVAADPEPFRLLLAAVIVLYLAVERLRRHRPERVLPISPALLLGTGLISGTLAGLVNVMAPVIIVFALETRLSVALMVPVFNVTFLASKSAQILTYSAAGLLSPKTVLSAIPITLVAVLFLWWGMGVRRRTDTAIYRAWLKAALWVIALLLVGQHLAG